MSICFEDIQEFATRQLYYAREEATTIQFAESFEMANKYSKSAKLSARSTLIGNDPDYSFLGNTCGIAAWGVLLNVDLRSSTTLAEMLGAKQMYLIMHTYMPTMIELVEQSEGKVVGLRGDGLIAAFGITKREDKFQQAVSSEVSDSALKAATNCGKAMVEAVQDIINPLFHENDMYDSLQIGVAIDAGDIVITRVGWKDANEVTTYGNPVNRACKQNKGQNEVVISKQAYDLYPSSKGGLMKFLARKNRDGDPDHPGFTVKYPEGVRKLVKVNRPVEKVGVDNVRIR